MMIDFKKLKELYQFTGSLSFSDIQVLIKAANLQSFPALAYLMEEGSYDKKVYFIRKGLLRTFIVNPKGDEITVALVRENQLYANYDVLLFEEPSRSYVQALEDTETFYLDFDKAQEILERNPKLEQNRKFLLRDILKRSLRQTESFVLYSPEERYINFVKNNPDLVNRVPDKYIANVLGITPVSLSRIRKRIAQKKIELL